MRALCAGLALCAVALVSLTGCGSQSDKSSVASNCQPAHKFNTIEKGKLTVAVTTFPPFSSVKDGKASGIDGDLITKFAAKECLTIVVQPVNYSSAVPAVQNGRADVAIGSFYRSKARAQIVNLTDPIYLDQMGLISKDGVSTVSGLQGRKVGAIDGYLWVADLQKVLGGNLKLYPSSLELQQDLKAGRIDVGIDGLGAAIDGFRNTDFKVKVTEPDPRVVASNEAGQTGFPYPKSNGALGTALNATIAQFHQDGTIKALLKQWGLPESSAEVGAPRLV